MQLFVEQGSNEAWLKLTTRARRTCPPLQLAQRQLDLPALHQAGGAKKARSGSSSQSSMGSADAAAAAALRRNNALPITSFFSKAPSGGRQ